MGKSELTLKLCRGSGYTSSVKRENEVQDWLKHHNIPLEDMAVRSIAYLVMRTSLSPSPKLTPFFMIMAV
jgi:hypothetical protein